MLGYCSNWAQEGLRLDSLFLWAGCLSLQRSLLGLFTKSSKHIPVNSYIVTGHGLCPTMSEHLEEIENGIHYSQYTLIGQEDYYQGHPLIDPTIIQITQECVNLFVIRRH